MTGSVKKLDSLEYYDTIKEGAELKDSTQLDGLKHGQWYDPKGVYAHCFQSGAEIKPVRKGETSDLAKFAQGYNPRTGHALVKQGAGKKRRPGYDFTQSVPKSVSVLWSQLSSRPDMQKMIEAAVMAAAKQGVDALNKYAGKTRLQTDGKTVPIDCTIAAGLFMDFTGRPVAADGSVLPESKMHLALNEAYSAKEIGAFIDPQLHVHTVLPNTVLCADGEYRALDGQTMMRWQGVMFESFHAALAHELQKLGLEIVLSEDKVAFELKVVPELACKGFSKRSAQVEHNKELLGFDDELSGERMLQHIKAFQKAGHLDEDAEAIIRQYIERGKIYGFDGPQAVEAMEKALAAGPWQIKHGQVQDIQKIMEALQAHDSLFTDAMLRAAALGSLTGHGTPAEIQSLVDKVIEGGLVRFGENGNLEFLATEKMVKIEDNIKVWSVEYKYERPFAPNSFQAAFAPIFAKSVEAGKPYSAEQEAVLQYAYESRDGMIAIQGRAGSGKTRAVEGLVELLQAGGLEVVGASLSWAASRNLADEGKLNNASAIADFTRKLETGEVKLTNKSVLIIDEAGIVGSVDMEKMIRAAREAGALVVLTGDTLQIGAVAAGGPFRMLIEEKALANNIDFEQKTDEEIAAMSRDEQVNYYLAQAQARGSADITEVRRQVNKEDAKAGLLLSKGNARAAIEQYAEWGRLHIASDPADARKIIFDKYMADRFSEKLAGKSQLMIAKTNKDVDALNEAIHKRLQEDGLVGADVQIQTKVKNSTKTMGFGVNDVIQFRTKSGSVLMETLGDSDDVADQKNAQKESGQVYNRTRAKILAIEGEGKDAVLTVQIFSGDELSDVTVKISGKDFKGGVLSIEHAYCMTIDSAQGQTFDLAYMLGVGYDRARAYVACTRHRGIKGDLEEGLTIVVDKDSLHKSVSRMYTNDEFVTRNDFTDEMAKEALIAQWATEKVKRTTVDYMRSKEASDRLLVLMGKYPEQREQAQNRLEALMATQMAGAVQLVSHGRAHYNHDESEQQSYFVNFRRGHRDFTIWGKDLERAVGKSGAQAGDYIRLKDEGKTAVTVNAPVKNEAGQVVGWEPKQVHRNTWSCEKLDPKAMLEAATEAQAAGKDETKRVEAAEQTAVAVIAKIKQQLNNVGRIWNKEKTDCVRIESPTPQAATSALTEWMKKFGQNKSATTTLHVTGPAPYQKAVAESLASRTIRSALGKIRVSSTKTLKAIKEVVATIAQRPKAPPKIDRVRAEEAAINSRKNWVATQLPAAERKPVHVETPEPTKPTRKRGHERTM